jgi:hypothetical protein
MARMGWRQCMREAHITSTRGARYVGLVHQGGTERCGNGGYWRRRRACRGSANGVAAGKLEQCQIHETHLISTRGANQVSLMHLEVWGGDQMVEHRQRRRTYQCHEDGS